MTVKAIPILTILANAQVHPDGTGVFFKIPAIGDGKHIGLLADDLPRIIEGFRQLEATCDRLRLAAGRPILKAVPGVPLEAKSVDLLPADDGSHVLLRIATRSGETVHIKFLPDLVAKAALDLAEVGAQMRRSAGNPQGRH